MHFLKIVEVEGADGVVIPRALLEKLRLNRGDTLAADIGADGFLELRSISADSTHLETKIDAIMDRFGDALTALSKK